MYFSLFFVGMNKYTYFNVVQLTVVPIFLPLLSPILLIPPPILNPPTIHSLCPWLLYICSLVTFANAFLLSVFSL